MEKTNSVVETDEKMSRRTFLQGIGVIAGSLGVGAALAGCTPASADSSSKTKDAGANTNSVTTGTNTADRNVAELEIPDTEAPDTTKYECDVLVVGGGFAGLSAAMEAKSKGQNVVMVDKGQPGYSGLTPFASSHRWFDADMGDDEAAFKECIQYGSEYLANMDWYQVWIDESKKTYEQLNEWGILDQYDRAADSGYCDSSDFVGYRKKFSDKDRRLKWMENLNNNGITVVSHTMITNLVDNGTRVTGAMGFHVQSGAVMKFAAKAVILCTGGGSYKPTGFPTSSDTFDGEYMAYQLGLPIAGKEFDDMHTTCSWAAGNAFLNNSWAYLNNIWLCGGDITADTVTSYAQGKGKAMVLSRVTAATGGLANTDGSESEDQANSTVTRRGGTATENPNDVRQGKKVDIEPKGDAYGAAVGMCAHLSSGVFTGLEPTAQAGYPGLYVAGDGTNASVVTGATYPVGVGFTSSFCSIQGRLAADEAVDYAATVELESISADTASALEEKILAPMNVASGFDATWARDELHSIMSPFWVTIIKDESSLTGTLSQVEHLRDMVGSKLMAKTSHDLRMCHEFQHKVLSAEMKLRASLERKESRGLSYRSDFPYRDDNYLCYITVQKGADGTMTTGKVDIKEEWKGDLSKDYADRILFRFPGEEKAKNLPAETSSGWGK